jgi:hypothetical protein
MINTAWKIMFFWFFGTLTVFYHSTFTPKHSKEQCHPLNKRVIILYLLQRQYKNRFQPNEWQSKWKEYTECLGHKYEFTADVFALLLLLGLLFSFAMTSGFYYWPGGLEPVCCKKRQKIVPDQLLVCGVGDLWRTWRIPNWF